MRQALRITKSSLTLAFLIVLSGCGKAPTSPSLPVHIPVPSPDVRAVSAHFLHLSYGFGGSLSRKIVHSPGQRVGSDFTYVGKSNTPLLDLAYAGSFPNLEAVITINGQPWWNTFRSCISRSGYEDDITLQAPSWSAPDTGTYVIAMTLDPADHYPELDESNNSDTLVVRALLGNLTALEIELDQTVSGVVVRADTVAAGTPVSIIVRSFCWGSFPSYRMKLDQNGSVLLDTITSCDSGDFPGFNNPELVWVAADPGVHTFTLSLDPDHETRESNLADDTTTATIVVTP